MSSISESVYASGVILSVDQYTVFPGTSGALKAILKDEGDSVQSGEPVFIIDNRVSSLNKDNALLSAEFAELENNQAKIKDLRTQAELAKKVRDQDSLLYTRQTNLWEKNVGSKLQLEQAKLNFEASKTRHESAVLKLNDLIKQLKFNEKQARQSYLISSELSGDFKVKSELDGEVYSILKNQGEMVNPQTPIAVIGKRNAFIIELQIDEYDITRLKTGQKVYITLDSYKGVVYEAELTKINPLMNERSKTFKVEAVFVKAPPTLYPNLSVEASIEIQSKENALTIPREYLYKNEYVITQNHDTLKVETGLKDYKLVEIVKGLSESESLIMPE